MRKQSKAFLANARSARSTWRVSSKIALHSLKELTARYALSIAVGDLQFLSDRWYVTHAGLLRIAHRNRCSGIRTAIERELSDPTSSRWVFKATVYKSPGSKAFVGYGDANPSNVSSLVRGAEMRVAETRAVNRALRKAYGIGLCSVEEMGYFPVAPADHLQFAILAAGPFSLSSNVLGRPCGRSRAAAQVSAFEDAPSPPSVLGQPHGGFSLASSPFARGNLISFPKTKARKHLTMLSA